MFKNYKIEYTDNNNMEWKIIKPQDYNRTLELYEVNSLGVVRHISSKKEVVKPPNLDRYFLLGHRINQSYLIDKYFSQSIMRV